MADKPLEDFTTRMNFPFLHGVYLALNAIPDAYLLMDASDCSFFIAENIQGNHDWNSALLDCTDFHRVANTGVCIRTIANDRSGVVSKLLRKIESSGRAKLIFISSMPKVTVLAMQYDKIARELDPPVTVPVAEVPNRSLSEDWLPGYADTMEAAAKALDLSGGRPEPENAAIVGYMMDRTEDDHTANIGELKRMLSEALNLKLISVWPGNDTVAAMTEIRNAGTIISFPYAREAARIVAKKTGARLIESELPFGIGHTRDWIAGLADALGEEKRAADFIGREMRIIIPKLEWVVPRVFLGKTVAYCGDPHLIRGLGSMADDFGFNLVSAAAFASEASYKEYCVRLNDFTPRVLYEPQPPFLAAGLKDILGNRPLDLLISNSVAAGMLKPHGLGNYPVMEFGYPSLTYHALFDSPFLGFRGAASFMNRMANALTAQR
jgi:nitrogenase molybdenum-iron protein alpha/beta subunit